MVITLQVLKANVFCQEDLLRSNIVESQAGIPFEVRITVLDTDCNPVADAFVDLWHCEYTFQLAITHCFHCSQATESRSQCKPSRAARRMLTVSFMQAMQAASTHRKPLDSPPPLPPFPPFHDTYQFA